MTRLSALALAAALTLGAGFTANAFAQPDHRPDGARPEMRQPPRDHQGMNQMRPGEGRPDFGNHDRRGPGGKDFNRPPDGKRPGAGMHRPDRPDRGPEQNMGRPGGPGHKPGQGMGRSGQPDRRPDMRGPDGHGPRSHFNGHRDFRHRG